MAGGKCDPKFTFIFQKWFLMAEVSYAWIDYIVWNLLTLKTCLTAILGSIFKFFNTKIFLWFKS